jgi:hypothetical protein
VARPVPSCADDGRWLIKPDAAHAAKQVQQVAARLSGFTRACSLGIEDFRSPDSGRLDGRPVLIDYGASFHHEDSVSALKLRLLAAKTVLTKVLEMTPTPREKLDELDATVADMRWEIAEIG